MFRKKFSLLTVCLLCAASGTLNAQTRPGYLQFNGTSSYAEIPDSDDFSVSTRGQLTVAAWIRPDTLDFPQQNLTEGYVNFLGKGEGAGANGQMEWAFRMYSHDAPTPAANTNRIGFFLYNASGGEGNGSYFQEAVHPGEWIHVVAVVDSERTAIFRNGILMDCDRYRGQVQPGEDCDPPNVVIQPQNGTAPVRLGTSDLQSYFKGGIRDVRIWNRTLTPTEVGQLYADNIVPRTNLVAEYKLSRYTGNQILDSAGTHNGSSVGATFGTPVFLSNLTNNQAALWFTDGASVSSGILLNELLPNGWRVAASADFNRDGWTDLALQNLTTQQVAIWYRRGSQIYLGTMINATLPANWSVVTADDFNGDSWPDLVLQNLNTRQVATWFLNGANVTGGLVLNEVLPENWKIAGAGDFNNDGSPDLVLENLTTNNVAFWLIQNWRVTAGRLTNTTLPAGWEVAGVGDFDSNGKDDLVLQNLNLNQAGYWFLNNWNVTNGALASEPLPVNWRIGSTQ